MTRIYTQEQHEQLLINDAKARNLSFEQFKTVLDDEIEFGTKGGKDCAPFLAAAARQLKLELKEMTCAYKQVKNADGGLQLVRRLVWDESRQEIFF